MQQDAVTIRAVETTDPIALLEPILSSFALALTMAAGGSDRQVRVERWACM
jgi:hypothetical protein